MPPASRILALPTAAALLGLAVPSPGAAASPEGKSAKVCTTCHKSVEPGTLRGSFDDVAMKARSFQLRIDGDAEVLSFDPATLKVVNAPETGDLEKVLKAIRKGMESRVDYVVDGNGKRAIALTLKPRLAIPEEQQVKLAALERLVALGPQEGRYFLFDARPAPKFAEGFIPTAENLPFPSFEKEKGKLPADKDALIIYYCAGVTCAMSPAAKKATEALGYTHVKIFHEGVPGWSKTNALALSPKLLEEVWLEKGQPIIVLDARTATKGGVIPGAAAMVDGTEQSTNRLYRFRKAKPPIVVYDDDGKGNAVAVAKAIVAAGHPAMVLAGGVAAWKAAGYALAQAAPAAEITYVPRPKPGSISVADFRALVAAIPADTIVLDVRAPDEVAAGSIKGSWNVPADQVADRLAELPKDKKIVCHCSTGTRAEMTYNVLKGAGFANVAFLNAPVEFDGGSVEIGE